MKPRTPLRKVSEKRLAANGGKIPFSIRKKPRKPIRKENPEATKKRRARNAKRMRSVEYQSARAGAMERANGRCEFTTRFPYAVGGVGNFLLRCPETECLQFHEEHYARGRILTKDDGKIYCRVHHQLVESLKPHKWHRRGF